jgi:hypothetical protein
MRVTNWARILPARGGEKLACPASQGCSLQSRIGEGRLARAAARRVYPAHLSTRPCRPNRNRKQPAGRAHDGHGDDGTVQRALSGRRCRFAAATRKVINPQNMRPSTARSTYQAERHSDAERDQHGDERITRDASLYFRARRANTVLRIDGGFATLSQAPPTASKTRWPANGVRFCNS